MTREEAIKYIKSRCIGSTEERDGTQWSEAMWTAIEALADRPTEWIPVSERLPENNGCMLVTIDDAIEFGKYEDGEWSIWVCEHWDEWDAKGVTAWMPLPEPYNCGAKMER